MTLARSLPKDGSGLPPQILASPSTSGHNKAGNKVGGRGNDSSFAQLKNFHNTAGGISQDIASTSGMLAELTQLVRQKSLFQDDSQKVNELVVRIKTAIENLNGRLDDAGRQIVQQKRTLGKNSQPAQEATNMVGQLQEEFGQAAAGFKTILQQRTDSIKETTNSKKNVYGSNDLLMEDVPVLNLENRPPVYNFSQNKSGNRNNGGLSNNFPTLDLTSGMMAAGEPTGSQLPRPHGAMSRSSATGISVPNYGGAMTPTYYGGQQNNSGTILSPFDIQQMEHESGQDQMMQLIPDQDYLRDRADAMQQVESNIVELGAVYNRLATMVHEHKDMVQRVEDNVDEANSMINLSLNTQDRKSVV